MADQDLDRQQAEEVANRRIKEGKELERCFHTPKSEWGEGPWQDEPDDLWMQAQRYDCASGLATMSAYRTMEHAKSQLIVLATEAAEAATQIFSDAK